MRGERHEALVEKRSGPNLDSLARAEQRLLLLREIRTRLASTEPFLVRFHYIVPKELD